MANFGSSAHLEPSLLNLQYRTFEALTFVIRPATTINVREFGVGQRTRMLPRE